MSHGIVPLRQQDNAIRVHAVIYKGIDGAHDLPGIHVDHREQALAHAGQVDKRVLHDGIAAVFCECDILHPPRCGWCGGWGLPVCRVCSPTEVRVTSRQCCAACSEACCHDSQGECINCYECFEQATVSEREWNLRPWVVGLLTAQLLALSSMVLVLLMRPAVILLQDWTGNAIAAVSTIALLVFLLLFRLLYWLFAALMSCSTPRAARSDISGGQVAGLFVFTLVPIALAYHLAHYLSFLLIVGQYMIPLLSDPLGRDCNLFGTALYMVDISIVNAMLSLWILAQPVVETG